METHLIEFVQKKQAVEALIALRGHHDHDLASRGFWAQTIAIVSWRLPGIMVLGDFLAKVEPFKVFFVL